MTDSDEPDSSHVTRSRRTLAGMVHLLTASGVLCCLLALEATADEDWRTALAWLFVAVAIDAVDGTLARAIDVKLVMPQFDGALLDNVVDYLSYVFLPAVIIHRSGLLPPDVSLTIAGALCLASAYQFCQGDAKTPDHFFKGFPSYWNVTALYLLAMKLSPVANCVVLVVLIVLVFVPIKYLYVTRTVPYRRVTWTLTVVWSLLVLAMLWQLPDPTPWIVRTSLAYVVYYTGMSLFLTLRSP